MNECLTTSQHEKQIGYWVSKKGKRMKWLYNISGLSTSFDDGRIIGQIDISELNEASGLAASRRHPGYLYSINDHSGLPTLYVINNVTAHVVAVLTVAAASNGDWEDLAVGRFVCFLFCLFFICLFVCLFVWLFTYLFIYLLNNYCWVFFLFNTCVFVCIMRI